MFFKPQFSQLASANSAIEWTESTWNPPRNVGRQLAQSPKELTFL